MCSLINKQLLLTAYAYLFITEQQKEQQGSEALQMKTQDTRGESEDTDAVTESEDTDAVTESKDTRGELKKSLALLNTWKNMEFESKLLELKQIDLESTGKSSAKAHKASMLITPDGEVELGSSVGPGVYPVGHADVIKIVPMKDRTDSGWFKNASAEVFGLQQLAKQESDVVKQGDSSAPAQEERKAAPMSNVVDANFPCLKDFGFGHMIEASKSPSPVFFLRMNKIGGVTLQTMFEHILLADKKKREKFVWFLLAKVVPVLHVLARKSLAHKDLHLGNIMLDADLRVWLIDFGECDLENVTEGRSADLEILANSVIGQLRNHLQISHVDDSASVATQAGLGDILRNLLTKPDLAGAGGPLQTLEEIVTKQKENLDFTDIEKLCRDTILDAATTKLTGPKKVQAPAPNVWIGF